MKSSRRGPTRRTILGASAGLLVWQPKIHAAPKGVVTVVGTGVQGFAGDGESVKTAKIDQPYGVLVGPDGALYWADFGSNRVLRFQSGRVSAVAGKGPKGHAGDGGQAKEALLSAPHEVRFDSKANMLIAERDANVVRFVERRTGKISTLVGTGEPGFSGDSGPSARPSSNSRIASCWTGATISLSATSRTIACGAAMPLVEFSPPLREMATSPIRRRKRR